MDAQIDGAPPDAGPLGTSAAATRAMSSTGTSIRSFSCFFSDASTTVTGRNSAALCSAFRLARSARSGLAANSSWISTSASVDPVSRNALPAFLRGFACDRRAFGTARSTVPPRNRATSSSGLCVADRPMRWSGPPSLVPSFGEPGLDVARNASNRSKDSARCAPRLVGTSA
jgi:hypothetical protein